MEESIWAYSIRELIFWIALNEAFDKLCHLACEKKLH